MIYSDLDHASNMFVQKLLESKILSDIEEQVGNNLTHTDLIKYLNNAKEVSNFLIRYPKPILTRLVYYKIISSQEIFKYKFIFDYFKISMYSPAESNSKYFDAYSHSPEGYFKIVFKGINFDYGPLMDEFKNILNAREADYKNALFIPLESISEFIKLYKDREIEWSIFCMQKGLLWTNELICSLKDVLDWERLHRNPSMPWNFEIIDSNKEKVNWAFISSYPFLKWELELLNKYKDYLIFSLDDKHFSKGGKNINGDKFYLLKDSDGLKGHFYSNLKGSISLSESIEWSEEIINSLQEYWNWSELSSNKAIHWSEELIDLFVDKIDFKALSINVSVNWTEFLIDKYFDKWNWEYLSGNYALPWSYGFIKKYEKEWRWKGSYYKKTRDTNESYQLSISINKGINWDEKMLSEWENKIDFWSLARFSKINSELIKLFYKKFDEQKLTEERYWKNSDWGWEKEEFYRSGWENLALNNNFFLTSADLVNYFNLKVPLNNLEEKSFNNVNTKDNFQLLKNLKECSILDVSINELIENELSWVKYLLNENFINISIWTKLIQPIFTQEYCTNYLIKLEMKINKLNVDREFSI